MIYSFNLLGFFRLKIIFCRAAILAVTVISFCVSPTLAQNNAKNSAKTASSTKTSSKTALGQSFIVSGFNVYVRENSAASAERIGQLTFGTIVRSAERSKTEETIGGKTGFWHKVELAGGKGGWVFGAFLKAFELNKRENIYKQITAEKLRVADRTFDQNTELYEFLTRAQSEVKTPAIAAEIGLWRFVALKAALSIIPFDKMGQAPYKDFTDKNSINIVYSEPSGLWLVRSERFWSLSKRYADLPIGEKIAWEAAKNPLPGECEGYLNCYLFLLRETHGAYLELFPKGTHAAEALKNLGDELAPIAADATKKEIYETPADVSDRAEFYQKIAELRSIVSRTGFFEKEAVLQQLDKIAEGYR